MQIKQQTRDRSMPIKTVGEIEEYQILVLFFRQIHNNSTLLLSPI